MLVLSRKENQRIVFPNLSIAIEIVRITGNSVRVGVDAPPEIRVLREEIANQQGILDSEDNTSKSFRHAVRNRLNTATLALHLMQRQLELGMLTEADATLSRTLNEFSLLDELMGSIPSSPSDKTSQSNRPVALLVDDDINERELLAGLLRLHGYEVDVVEDGMAALTYLAEHNRPDCVLLDMEMPRMDGKSTISAIRHDPKFKDLKVFAISGMDQSAVDLPEGDRGIDHWFSKPLRPAEFMNDLDTEIGRQTTAI